VNRMGFNGRVQLVYREGLIGVKRGFNRCERVLIGVPALG
jgi:hypothetical protein